MDIYKLYTYKSRNETTNEKKNWKPQEQQRKTEKTQKEIKKINRPLANSSQVYNEPLPCTWAYGLLHTPYCPKASEIIPHYFFFSPFL